MAAAAIADYATKLDVEGVAFSALVTPPGSSKTHFFDSAGVRGLEIGGKFVAFTAICIYLESDVISALVEKWQGKAAAELNGSLEFFRDIAGGHFEKFTRGVNIWKEMGIYTNAERK